MKPGRSKLVAEYDGDRIFVRCPECDTRQELVDYRVDKRGMVWPWFVCGVTECEFGGAIWIVNWGN